MSNDIEVFEFHADGRRIFHDLAGRRWCFVDRYLPIGWPDRMIINPPMAIVHDGGGVWRCPEIGCFCFDPEDLRVEYLDAATNRRSS